MNIILLSGGSGKRLWPLSNNVRSKQFLKIFRREDGTYESMVERMYRMIMETDEKATVTIATSQEQTAYIREQIGESIGISIEPCRRDTFPAIALAVSYLHDVKKLDADEVVIVCPADSFVDREYYHALKELNEIADAGEAPLNLIGIEPTSPSTKFGYIIPAVQGKVSPVSSFKEKPDEQLARQYISQGALINAGVFAFRLKYILDISERIFGTSDYRELRDNYGNLQKISFDYAVVEKERNIRVLRFSGVWEDVGTWDSLTEKIDDEVIGRAVTVECDNTHVVNETDIPVVAIGVRDLIIVSTPDGILVADKNDRELIDSYLKKM